MKCRRHTCDNEVPNSNRKKFFCSKACLTRYCVDRRRLEIKFKAVQYKGGKCEICGFTGSPACFDFHHLDPTEKSFAVSCAPHARSWERTKEEIDKCQLLCSNCHRRVEFEKTMSLKTFIPELLEKYGCNTSDALLPDTTMLAKPRVVDKACSACGRPFRPDKPASKFCSKDCAASSRRVATRPDKDALLSLISKHSFLEVGRMFGVSDNSIRKWLK